MECQEDNNKLIVEKYNERIASLKLNYSPMLEKLMKIAPSKDKIKQIKIIQKILNGEMSTCKSKQVEVKLKYLDSVEKSLELIRKKTKNSKRGKQNVFKADGQPNTTATSNNIESREVSEKKALEESHNDVADYYAQMTAKINVDISNNPKLDLKMPTETITSNLAPSPVPDKPFLPTTESTESKQKENMKNNCNSNNLDLSKNKNKSESETEMKSKRLSQPDSPYASLAEVNLNPLYSKVKEDNLMLKRHLVSMKHGTVIDLNKDTSKKHARSNEQNELKKPFNNQEETFVSSCQTTERKTLIPSSSIPIVQRDESAMISQVQSQSYVVTSQISHQLPAFNYSLIPVLSTNTPSYSLLYSTQPQYLVSYPLPSASQISNLIGCKSICSDSHSALANNYTLHTNQLTGLTEYSNNDLLAKVPNNYDQYAQTNMNRNGSKLFYYENRHSLSLRDPRLNSFSKNQSSYSIKSFETKSTSKELMECNKHSTYLEHRMSKINWSKQQHERNSNKSIEYLDRSERLNPSQSTKTIIHKHIELNENNKTDEMCKEKEQNGYRSPLDNLYKSPMNNTQSTKFNNRNSPTYKKNIFHSEKQDQLKNVNISLPVNQKSLSNSPNAKGIDIDNKIKLVAHTNSSVKSVQHSKKVQNTEVKSVNTKHKPQFPNNNHQEQTTTLKDECKIVGCPKDPIEPKSISGKCGKHINKKSKLEIEGELKPNEQLNADNSVPKTTPTLDFDSSVTKPEATRINNTEVLLAGKKCNTEKKEPKCSVSKFETVSQEKDLPSKKRQRMKSKKKKVNSKSCPISPKQTDEKSTQIKPRKNSTLKVTALINETKIHENSKQSSKHTDTYLPPIISKVKPSNKRTKTIDKQYQEPPSKKSKKLSEDNENISSAENTLKLNIADKKKKTFDSNKTELVKDKNSQNLGKINSSKTRDADTEVNKKSDGNKIPLESDDESVRNVSSSDEKVPSNSNVDTMKLLKDLVCNPTTAEVIKTFCKCISSISDKQDSTVKIDNILTDDVKNRDDCNPNVSSSNDLYLECNQNLPEQQNEKHTVTSYPPLSDFTKIEKEGNSIAKVEKVTAKYETDKPMEIDEDIEVIFENISKGSTVEDCKKATLEKNNNSYFKCTDSKNKNTNLDNKNVQDIITINSKNVTISMVSNKPGKSSPQKIEVDPEIKVYPKNSLIHTINEIKPRNEHFKNAFNEHDNQELIDTKQSNTTLINYSIPLNSYLNCAPLIIKNKTEEGYWKVSHEGVSKEELPLQVIEETNYKQDVKEMIDYKDNSYEEFIKSEVVEMSDCVSIEEDNKWCIFAKDWLSEVGGLETDIEEIQTSGTESIVDEMDMLSALNAEWQMETLSDGENNIRVNENLIEDFHQTWKSPTAYSIMLIKEKLTHFYKCMDKDCVFTSLRKMGFIQHLQNHVENSDDAGKEKRDWKLCPYCCQVYSDVSLYMNHLHTVHADCRVQCFYCFNRSNSISTAKKHLRECHPGKPLRSLYCYAVGKHVELYSVKTEN